MAKKASLTAIDKETPIEANLNTESQTVAPSPEAAPTLVSTDIFNDLDALREQSKPAVRRRSVLVNVFVSKHPPSNRHYRVHPDEHMALDATVIWDNDDCYFVTPGMRNTPKLIKRLRYVKLHLAVLWPDGQPVIWPVPVAQGNDFKIWRSYRRAAELAIDNWMQISWDSERRDFLIEQAENIPHQPQWPQESFANLLKIAFEGHIIDNENHAYVQILRGFAD